MLHIVYVANAHAFEDAKRPMPAQRGGHRRLGAGAYAGLSGKERKHAKQRLRRQAVSRQVGRRHRLKHLGTHRA